MFAGSKSRGVGVDRSLWGWGTLVAMDPVRVDEGIVKKTEFFSLDGRRDEEAVGWFRGEGGHVEQEAFVRV